jgi:hypothetical protein
MFPLSSLSCEEPLLVEGKLAGQLGNQMFQIAATVAHAFKNRAKPVFPDLIYKKQYGIETNYQHVFFRLDTTLLSGPRDHYIQQEYHYSPLPFQGTMSIEGFFQSEKFFKDYRTEVLELFQPSKAILEKLQNRYPHILSHEKSVAVHVRMYKDTTPDFHPFVKWDYILKGMELFDPESLFVIFSDQIELTEKILTKLCPKKNLVFISKNPHYLDLYLMSFCKHQIISNSSFSWWGAYLNPNPNKIVIAPDTQRWFGPNYPWNTQDILPKGWLEIKRVSSPKRLLITKVE